MLIVLARFNMMYYHEGNGMDGTAPDGWVAATLGRLDEANTPPWHDATADSERTGTMTETTEPRKWLYGLTADEWLHLAAEGQDSEVPPCCGNISELREYLNALATCQGQGESGIMYRAVLESYGAAVSDHETVADAGAFPLLHRVLAGIRAAQAADEEFAKTYQAAIRARRETSEA